MNLCQFDPAGDVASQAQRDVVSISRPELDLDELRRGLHRILADKWGKKKGVQLSSRGRK
jgi:hypothetical protein